MSKSSSATNNSATPAKPDISAGSGSPAKSAIPADSTSPNSTAESTNPASPAGLDSIGSTGSPAISDDAVTLVIPQFLQNSLDCFKASSKDDISQSYKIILKSPEDKTLYVENEQDLRDTLKQYCLYKQLCEKVDEEMKKLNLEFQLSDHSVRLIKSPAARGQNDYSRGPKFDYTRPAENFGCDEACGRTTRVTFPTDFPLSTIAPVPTAPPGVAPPEPPKVGACDEACQHAQGKKCCTIL